MRFLRKLFGGKQPATSTSTPANDPDMIKVFDGYGRELFITEQQWRDHVLLGNLEKARDNPDELYSMLVGALQDGFAADVIPHAERLVSIDPIPSRGVTILGIVYMEVGRLGEAQHVLENFLAKHGEEGIVLTNLAKVYSRRGDEGRAEATLWHALELDPNQDNGFDWYIAMQSDRGGKSAAMEAFRRVATLPGSWRARLWLAREELQSGNLAAAMALYSEALTMAERPVPADLLMQMSGDLGNAGHLSEIVKLTAAYFDPAIHGLQVGNNLIKANLGLGRLQEAKRIIDQLYLQKRPDWNDALRFWDTEVARASVGSAPPAQTEQLSVSVLSIEGPLWARDGSPFARLMPAKLGAAPRVGVFGSTALLPERPERPALQLADTPGRITRGIPLLFTEHIHMTTDGVAQALMPWAQGEGAVLFSDPYQAPDLCELAAQVHDSPAFMVGVTLDTTATTWRLAMELVRVRDKIRLDEASIEIDSQNPGPAVDRLATLTEKMLLKNTDVTAAPAPSWYSRPIGVDASDYLLRLEQQLAVTCNTLAFLKGGELFGHHEIVDGILQLCARQPMNATVRMVLAQTLRQMRKIVPDMLAEYKEKVDLLQGSHPIPGDVGKVIDSAIRELFAT
ncbi:MAG TPA: tetratricopeptide repeat protein [Thermoanaerobaculia bacterium]